jgi:hypothetical protein
MVYGNHDNEAGPDKVTRAEQFAMYAAHPSFIGYYVEAADKGTGAQDEQGDHYGTHHLTVKNSAGTAPAFNIWMFDSGSYDPRGGYSSVQKQQVDWFRAESARTGNLPSLAFQHIIVPEIFDKLPAATKDTPGAIGHSFVVDGAKVTKYITGNLPLGVAGELREGPSPGEYNYGQYDALCAAGVLALFVGHDHVNTYELVLDGTDLVNSMSTGFGSYGDIDMRGVRVITLDESDLTTYKTKNVSYQTFYGIFGKNPLREARLSMFQSLATPATFLDWISFKPLFWLLGLFGM